MPPFFSGYFCFFSAQNFVEEKSLQRLETQLSSLNSLQYVGSQEGIWFCEHSCFFQEQAESSRGEDMGKCWLATSEQFISPMQAKITFYHHVFSLFLMVWDVSTECVLAQTTVASLVDYHDGPSLSFDLHWRGDGTSREVTGQNTLQVTWRALEGRRVSGAFFFCGLCLKNRDFVKWFWSHP